MQHASWCRTLLLSLAIMLGVPSPCQAEDAAPAIDPDLIAWAEKTVEARSKVAPKASELDGGVGWLNVSKPLRLGEELRGKVVILDFWCYCCINCIHVLPDLEYLEKKYAGEAFAVVGVHSAKFEHEKDDAAIRDAIRRYEIHHPVVNDANFKIWRAYGANSWPSFAVITPDGKLLGMLPGEGNLAELDALTHVLLKRFKAKGDMNTKPLPIRLERDQQTSTALSYPGKVCVDEARGSLFIADTNHHRVVEVALKDGQFRRAWGDGTRGRRDGPLVAPGTKAVARFFRPQGLTRVGEHDLYVCDTENHLLRKIDLQTGTVATVAGTGKQGRARTDTGAGLKTALSNPWDVLNVKGVGLVIAMAGTHQLWRYNIKTGTVGVWAGTGHEQRLDADVLNESAFAQPSGLASDGTSLFVADSESSSIVRIGLPNGPVETWAGASKAPRDLFHFGNEDGKGLGRRFQHCLGVTFFGDALYVADSYNHRIKRVGLRGDAAQVVSSVWGGRAAGYRDTSSVERAKDGAHTKDVKRAREPALFDDPGGIDSDSKRLYVADTNNHAIRVLDPKSGVVSTMKLRGVPIPMAAVASPTTSTSPWPHVPDVERVFLKPIHVAAEQPWVLDLTAQLPPGWKLTPGTPARVRATGIGDKPIAAPLVNGRATLALPKLGEGEHKVMVQWVYYLCTDGAHGGMCRLRAVDMPLTVVAKDGLAAKVSLTDSAPAK